MNQTQQLISALKRSLKARGLTYRDVARELGLSEASVKRVFSAGTFTLERLEQICGLLDMTIYELSRMTAMATVEKPNRLSWEQEQALADNPSLFTYFYLLLNGWTHAGICAEFGLSETASIRRLAALDRLKLIELLPGNKVRLLTAHTILWRRDGPVQQKYEKQVRRDFMHSKFDGPDEALHFQAVELSEYSIKAMHKKVDTLIREIEELAETDMMVAPEERHWIGLVLGYRPWMFSPIILKKRP